MKRVAIVMLLMVSISLVGLSGCAALSKPGTELDADRGWTVINNNLHQIEGPLPAEPERAFRVYRSGAPSKETFELWCTEFGIERVIVLSGDAGKHELQYQSEGTCQDIEVIYNVEQSHTKPVSDGFLEFFEEQIEKAEQDNVGILFRCQTGSHRAGRTAAYYQMKYQGLSADQAIEIMDHKGLLMPLFDPDLVPQVQAMEDYLEGRECSQKEKYCVEINSDKWMP